MEEEQKRTNHGYITQLGVVCYTSEGAFYVPLEAVDCLKICDNMRIRGVYRLEKGGFFSEYNEYSIDMHKGFGDIYDDTFASKYVDEIIIQHVFDTHTIYSLNVVARIVQRCIN